MRKLVAVTLGGLVLLCVTAASLWFAAWLRKPPRVPDATAIQEIGAAAVAELAAAYPETQGGLVRRDAHAKAHGCVKAIFHTDPGLPADLRVGTFAVPGQGFKALIRFSNGAMRPAPDQDPDGRGMAVKLIDSDPMRAGSPRGRPPHDLLMVDYPEFFLANMDDYRLFMRAHALRGTSQDLKAYFQPGWNPFSWHLSEAKIAIATATTVISSPLHADYFSMTPYAFGVGRAVKYAMRPCAGRPEATAEAADPNSLRAALTRELARTPACFELFVQVAPNDVDLNDATQHWPLESAPLRKVGRLDLPVQTVARPDRDAACESLSFNPGRTPPEQAPIGDINRARTRVYELIAGYRTKRNGVTPPDPEATWDQF